MWGGNHGSGGSGHTHWQAHQFLDEKSGWQGKEPRHHVIHVTVCGGSEKSTVRMRVGDTGDWTSLEQTLAPDLPDWRKLLIVQRHGTEQFGRHHVKRRSGHGVHHRN